MLFYTGIEVCSSENGTLAVEGILLYIFQMYPNNVGFVLQH